MDKYLTLFTEDLDAAFDAEKLFPVKKTFRGWLQHTFGRKKVVVKNGKTTQLVTKGLTVALKH